MASHGLSKDEIERYCRQMIIPGIGGCGQERLKHASVLIVGAGGLGCPVGLYLAAAGVGHLGVVDYDLVEVSNIHRQIAHRESTIGLPKTESLAQAIKSMNSSVKVSEFNLTISSETALDIVENFDVVVDASDNVVTRYLLSDACVLAGRKPLVSGAALRLDGQLTTYIWNGSPCYRCIYPEPPPASAVTNCDTGGVLGPITGLIGSLQALEVLRMITAQKPNYAGLMLTFNGDWGHSRVLKLRRRRGDCAVCGDTPSIKSLIDYELFCGSKAHDKTKSISLLNPTQRMEASDFGQLHGNALVIDVRSPIHFEIFHLPETHNFPLPLIPDQIDKIKRLIDENPERPIVCICRRGNDSQRAVKLLQQYGINNAQDVVGGLAEVARVVDQTLPVKTVSTTSNSLFQILRRPLLLCRQVSSSVAGKLVNKEAETGFDVAWRTMNQAERLKLIKQYSSVESQDWHTLTLEQKRALYTMAYGAPEIIDPYETRKIAGGVAAVLTVGVATFALIRSFANPAPITLTPEWKKATEERLRQNHVNPIYGISSKNDTNPENMEIH